MKSYLEWISLMIIGAIYVCLVHQDNQYQIFILYIASTILLKIIEIRNKD